MRPTDPTQLGEFTILEKIGQGAMGAVYKAHQSSLGRVVALKLLPAHYAGDGDFVARFKREASAAAALNHPNIVQIYAAGQDDGAHYFAMEYVEGESLGARLERKGRIDARQVLAVAHYVAQALDYAWKKAAVVHRDIKPDNIFLSREGTVKLGDLGLAKMLESEGAGLTQTGTTMGTPYYVSPEQAVGNKEIDFRADIYSLGCTIFHAVSGQTPYRGDSAMSVMIQHITQPAPKIQAAWPECPPALVGLLDRMLRKKPEERHESYEVLMQQLLWVGERLDPPSASAVAAMSMVVPTPSAPEASEASALRSAKAASARAAKAPPAAGKAWKALVIVAALLGVAAGLAIWQPWKKATSPVAAVAVAPGSASIQPAPSKATPMVAAVRPKETSAAMAASKISSTPVSTPAQSAPAATPRPRVADAEGFVSLLDGGHIDGWKQIGTGGFTVEGGAWTSWVAKTGEGCWWYTAERFGDFTLKLDFRIATPGGNSGVYVRFPNPGDDVSVPMKQAYQIDVSEERNPFEKTGAICGLKAPISEPQKALDWNEMEISVVGQHYLVKVNGILVNDFTGNRGTSGYLGLQNCRVGGVQYRNIRIKDANPATLMAAATPAPVATPAPSAGPDAEGFVPLFDSDHFPAWKAMGSGGFTMQGGVATSWVGKREGGSWWYTREPYDNFVFKTDFRISTPDGNSGVYVRCPRPDGDGVAAAVGGYQIDVSEDPNPFEMTGAICGIKAPTSVPQNKRDWNELEINVVSQHYTVKVNGVLVNDFTGNKRTSGYIGLQEYKVGGVQFRNARVKDLSSPTAVAATAAELNSSARWKNAINLLPAIDLAADTVAGTFVAGADGLFTSGNGLAKLELPYRPPAEYDFRMSFTYRDGVGELSQLLSRGGRAFEWEMGGNGAFFGFQTIAGKNAAQNPTTKRFRLEKNRKYTSLVQVRNDGLKAYMDDTLIAEWKTNYSDMGVWAHWKLRDDARLGAGTLSTAATIHALEVLEVTGQGQLLRLAKPGGASTPTLAPPLLQGPVDSEGFTSLFNGRDLTGWDGDRRFWSVQNGTITGEAKTNGMFPANTFLVWKGGQPRDFELRFSFRITAGNSGVQYRSRVVDASAWRVLGYQYEISAIQTGSNGALYEEGGQRKGLGGNPGGTFMASLGEKVIMAADDRKQLLGHLSAPFKYRIDNWNDAVIIAQATHLTHKLNGDTCVELADEDEKARAMAGVLALQLHAGPPQRVQFKDVRMRNISTP